MRARSLLVCSLLGAITLGIYTSAAAQTPSRRVFEVSMTSYKFEPNELRFNEGDTVVIRIKNNDSQRDQWHALTSRYLTDIPVTIRGDSREYRMGTAEGRRWIAVTEQGKQAEIEFVAQGRGSHAFICGVTDHAWRGQTGAFFIQPAGSP